MYKNESNNRRLALLDSLRGITLISMILYHACWDAVYIIGADWSWYRSRSGFIWQQSICWTFILLSGFCIPFSKRLLRRGLTVFGAGALVMLVTNLVLPEDRVIFGVLTLIGSCMFCRDINSGVVGTGLLHRILPVIPHITAALPETLYRNLFTAYLGFPPPSFYSTDYFSLIPWAFLYLCGYELHRIAREKGVLASQVFKKEIRPLSFLGRNSLTIYLLHQPVLYGLVLLYSAAT